MKPQGNGLSDVYNEMDCAMKKILSLTVVIVLCVAAASACAQSIGHFTALTGTVEVRSFHEDEARQAKTGGPVFVSDVVKTVDDARAEITFRDGNIVRLASDTRLRVSEYTMQGPKSSEIIRLFRGKIRNIVTVVFDRNFLNKKGRYEVHTGIAVCGVRGTDFFAFHERGVSGAAFVEGRGYAYSSEAPGDVVTLAAGQQMTARAATEPPQITPARSKDIEQFKKETQTRAQKGKEAPAKKAVPNVSKQKKEQKKDGFLEGLKGLFQSSAAKNKEKGSAEAKGKSSSQGKSAEAPGQSSSGKGASGESAASGGKGSNSGESAGGGSSSGAGNSGGGNSGGGNSGGGNSGGGNSGGGNSGGGNSGGGNSGGGNSGGGNSGGGNSGGNSGGGNSGGNSGGGHGGGKK